jgi:biopolymer transport protein ExbD
MSTFGRLDVIVLAFMLIHVFAVAIRICWRCYLSRRTQVVDSAAKRTLAAALGIEVGNLKSIAITAPYLGLAGTCLGIWSALTGGAMQKDAFIALISTQMALALIPTAVAIPVAVLATSFYNFLRTRIDLLEGEAYNEGQHGVRYFRETRRFPPTKRLAELPGFGLIAAPALAFAIAGFMTFASFHTSTGFDVELASARCEFDGEDRLIILRITDAGKVFLNYEQEDWNTLPDRLSEIYSWREHRTLYLLSDSRVPFQTVAHALDVVESAPAPAGPHVAGMRMDRLNIKVRLVTPAALNADCLKPVVTGSGHPVLR